MTDSCINKMSVEGFPGCSSPSPSACLPVGRERGWAEVYRLNTSIHRISFVPATDVPHLC